MGLISCAKSTKSDSWTFRNMNWLLLYGARCSIVFFIFSRPVADMAQWHTCAAASSKASRRPDLAAEPTQGAVARRHRDGNRQTGCVTSQRFSSLILSASVTSLFIRRQLGIKTTSGDAGGGTKVIKSVNDWIRVAYAATLTGETLLTINAKAIISLRHRVPMPTRCFSSLPGWRDTSHSREVTWRGKEMLSVSALSDGCGWHTTWTDKIFTELWARDISGRHNNILWNLDCSDSHRRCLWLILNFTIQFQVIESFISLFFSPVHFPRYNVNS